ARGAARRRWPPSGRAAPRSTRAGPLPLDVVDLSASEASPGQLSTPTPPGADAHLAQSDRRDAPLAESDPTDHGPRTPSPRSPLSASEASPGQLSAPATPGADIHLAQSGPSDAHLAQS